MKSWFTPAHAVNDAAIQRNGWFTLDTETSGLYEDGDDESPPARVATASIAWLLTEDEGDRYDEFPNVTVHRERLFADVAVKGPETSALIASVAWPFDQGAVDKPEYNGQMMLFDEPNLPKAEWSFLLDLCLDTEQVYHNAKFDIHKMRVGTRKWEGVDLLYGMNWDTQSGNHFMYPMIGTTSLKPSVKILCGKDAADEQAAVKAYLKKAKLPAGRYDLVPWDIIGPYADLDARLTMMLYLRQLIDLDQAVALGVIDGSNQFSARDLVHRRFDTTKVLYRMEKRGVPYDEVRSRETALEGDKRADEYAKVLPFSPPTSHKAKHFFFEEGKTNKGVRCLNHPPYSVTETGQPQLTEEIVSRMVDDGVPHAFTWRQYNKIKTSVNMWYRGYADKMGADGRLRTCFRQNGTRSSRFSVERVNLQAIPQDYRLEGYEALAGLPTPRELIASGVPEGWGIWELDLAQAELRVAALYAKCQTMLNMIMEGVDLHSFTTKALFPKVDEKSSEWGMWRQVGKRGNFSLLFGAGWETFGKMLAKETGMILAEKELRRIVREWNQLYPEFGSEIDRTSRKVRSRAHRYGVGWVQFQNGERRYFAKNEDFHKAFNQRVQGNLAQFGIDWMLMSDQYLMAQGLEDTPIGGAGLVLTIHDSQVLLLPDDGRGNVMAERCAGFANTIWQRMFKGVPGGSEPKRWAA